MDAPSAPVLPRKRRLLPAPTIRLRLTITYGLVFLVTGAVLLSIAYVLVRHNLELRPDFPGVRRKLGLPPYQGTFTRPPGFAPGSRLRAVAEAVRDQFAGDTLHRLIVEYLAALAVMGAISIAAGWVMAGRALGPLRAVTATARRVSGDNLGERIGLGGPEDELKQLADTFDRMLERLDAAFAGQRRFVANASHELRTPLAIMRTEVDVALADEDASVEELRAMGEAVRETVDRSEGLIEALLVLARCDAVAGHDLVDLATLAGDCITDLRAQSRRAAVTVYAELAPAPVRGERQLLERMVANLIDNGLRHNAPGGYLRVQSSVEDGAAVLSVRNGGAVIAAEDVPGLAEPFRRLDRSSGGYGLGLSIVRSVAQAHHGTAELRAPADGGLLVRVIVPVDASARTEGLTNKPRPLTRI